MKINLADRETLAKSYLRNTLKAKKKQKKKRKKKRRRSAGVRRLNDIFVIYFGGGGGEEEAKWLVLLLSFPLFDQRKRCLDSALRTTSAKGRLFGRSMGRPKTRSQISWASGPNPRLTPNIAV